VLTEPEKTIDRIHDIVPEEAKITNITFDEVTCEVLIEARKTRTCNWKIRINITRNYQKNRMVS